MTIVVFMGMIFIESLLEGVLEYRAAVIQSGYHRKLKRRA